MIRAAWASACLALVTACAAGADWVRAGTGTNQPIWGIRGGLLWAVHPGGFRGGEPRGLIRLGYPVLPGGGYDLINFIAVEPVVKGQKGFSELERSTLDRVQGKRIWAVDSTGAASSQGLHPGRVSRLSPGAEELEVTLKIEPFDNGARVRIVARQRSDRPDEIDLAVHAESDSAPLDYCILTATMGNLARTRTLWLKNETISSLKLYPDYTEDGFAPPSVFTQDRLHRSADGSVLVALTTDETNPAAAFPFPRSRLWYYGGVSVTQYWRAAAGTFGSDLHGVVNGRYTYWMSERPIPGGVAYENFELRTRFRDGQRFVFGITRKTPRELGFTAQPAAGSSGGR